jgi:hypothetical protein
MTMTEQPHEPDDVAEEKARRQRDERESIADGDGTGSTGDEQHRQESGYSTEDEQGAAQPSPDES